MLLDHTLSEEDIQGIWVNHVPRKSRIIVRRVGRRDNVIAMGRKDRVESPRRYEGMERIQGREFDRSRLYWLLQRGKGASLCTSVDARRWEPYDFGFRYRYPQGGPFVGPGKIRNTVYGAAAVHEAAYMSKQLK
jgi:hypothetical protein